MNIVKLTEKAVCVPELQKCTFCVPRKISRIPVCVPRKILRIPVCVPRKIGRNLDTLILAKSKWDANWIQSKLRGISEKADLNTVCEQLKATRHVNIPSGVFKWEGPRSKRGQDPMNDCYRRGMGAVTRQDGGPEAQPLKIFESVSIKRSSVEILQYIFHNIES